MLEATSQALSGSTGLVMFLLGYLFVVSAFSALLGLGWSLESDPSLTTWPQPPSYNRVFSLAFLCLLAALGGFPPFFLLGPKLAVFSWLVGLGAWGSVLLSALVLLMGWYMYWQAATGLFDMGGAPVKPTKPLTSGGALMILSCMFLPLALSGFLLDMWALGHWVV